MNIDKAYVLQFVKQMIQLILSPSRGWEDVSASVHNPDWLERHGFVPFLIVTGLSEFLPMLYSHGGGFAACLLRGVIICVAMFCSLYVARLFMDITYARYIDRHVNKAKLSLFVTYLIGLNCLYTIITNAFPATMTLLKLLPLLSVIVVFRAVRFVGVSEDNQLSFTGLSLVAVLACPLAICGVLMLLV